MALMIWIDKLEVSRRPVTLEELIDSNSPYARLADLFGLTRAAPPAAGGSPPREQLPSIDGFTIGCRSTLELILDIARALGNSAGTSGSSDEMTIIAELAMALARLPGEPYVRGGAATHFLSRATWPVPNSCTDSTPHPPSAYPAPEPWDCQSALRYAQAIAGAGRGESNNAPNLDYRLSNGFVGLIDARIAEGMRLARPAGATADSLLQALYRRVGAYEGTQRLARLPGFYLAQSRPNTAPRAETTAEEAEQLATVVRFHRALFNSLENVPEVKDARAALSFWVGYEQYALICLSLVILALLFSQWLKDLPQFSVNGLVAARLRTMSEDDNARSRLTAGRKTRDAILKTLKANGDGRSFIAIDLLDKGLDELASNTTTRGSAIPLETWCQQAAEALEDSRWLFAWSLSALPAIGFLGTVRGILGALGGADALSSVTGRAEQAIAIGNVSGSLSLAFSTTMIALLSLLVLGLLDQWQAKSERRMIEDTEQLLTEKIQPKNV